MKKTTTGYTIPDRLSPGSARTVPVIAHQGEGVKWASDDNNKIRTRTNISIGTWNVRTLRPPGKLEELTHEMRRYRWSVYSVRYDGRTLAKQLLRMDISFTSVAKRTDMKMVLVFLFTRTP